MRAALMKKTIGASVEHRVGASVRRTPLLTRRTRWFEVRQQNVAAVSFHNPIRVPQINCEPTLVHSTSFDFNFIDHKTKDFVFLDLWSRLCAEPLHFRFKLKLKFKDELDAKEDIQAQLKVLRKNKLIPDGFRLNKLCEIKSEPALKRLFQDKVQDAPEKLVLAKLKATEGLYEGCEIDFYFGYDDNTLTMDLYGIQVNGHHPEEQYSWHDEFCQDQMRVIQDELGSQGAFLFQFAGEDVELKVSKGSRLLAPEEPDRLIPHPHKKDHYLLSIEEGYVIIALENDKPVLLNNKSDIHNVERIKSSESKTWSLGSFQFEIKNDKQSVSLSSKGKNLLDHALRAVQTDSGYVIRVEEKGEDRFYQVTVIDKDHKAVEVILEPVDCENFYDLWFQSNSRAQAQAKLKTRLQSHPYLNDRLLFTLDSDEIVEVVYDESGQFDGFRGSALLLGYQDELSLDIDGLKSPLNLLIGEQTLIASIDDRILSKESHDLFQLKDGGYLISVAGHILLIKTKQTPRGKKILVLEGQIDDYSDLIVPFDENKVQVSPADPQVKNRSISVFAEGELESDHTKIIFKEEHNKDSIQVTLNSTYRHGDLKAGMPIQPTFSTGDLWGEAIINGQVVPLIHLYANVFCAGALKFSIDEIECYEGSVIAMISITQNENSEGGTVLNKARPQKAIASNPKGNQKPEARPVPKPKKETVSVGEIQGKVVAHVRQDKYNNLARLHFGRGQTFSTPLDKIRAALVAAQLFNEPVRLELPLGKQTILFEADFKSTKGILELETGNIKIHETDSGRIKEYHAELIKIDSDPVGLYRLRYGDSFYSVYCEHGAIFLYDHGMSEQGFAIDYAWYFSVRAQSIRMAVDLSFRLSGLSRGKDGQFTWKKPRNEVVPEHLIREFTQWYDIGDGLRVGFLYKAEVINTNKNSKDDDFRDYKQIWYAAKGYVDDRKNNKRYETKMGDYTHLMVDTTLKTPFSLKVSQYPNTIPSIPMMVMVSGYLFMFPQGVVPDRLTSQNEVQCIDLNHSDVRGFVDFIKAVALRMFQFPEEHVYGGPTHNKEELEDAMRAVMEGIEKSVDDLESSVHASSDDIPEDSDDITGISAGYYYDAKKGWRAGIYLAPHAKTLSLKLADEEDPKVNSDWRALAQSYFGQGAFEVYPGDLQDPVALELQAIKKIFESKSHRMSLEEVFSFERTPDRLMALHDNDQTTVSVDKGGLEITSVASGKKLKIHIPFSKNKSNGDSHFAFDKSGKLNVQLSLEGQQKTAKVTKARWDRAREFEILTFEQAGFKLLYNRKTKSAQVIPLVYDKNGAPWIYEAYKLLSLTDRGEE